MGIPMPESLIQASADTSFFIRLMNDRDPLHPNAREYFEFLMKNDHVLTLSTIAIAEYCVRGRIDELPLANLNVIPFESSHAERSGAFAGAAFDAGIIVSERRIIPNDCNLFAQADIEGATLFLTSDERSRNLYKLIKERFGVKFRFVNIREPIDAVLT